MTNIPDLASMFDPNADFKANNEAASNFLAEDPEMGLSANSISKAVEANKISNWGGANAGEATQATEGGGGGTTTEQAPKKFDYPTFLKGIKDKYPKSSELIRKSGDVLPNTITDDITKQLMTYDEFREDIDGNPTVNDFGFSAADKIAVDLGSEYNKNVKFSLPYAQTSEDANPAKTAAIRSENEKIKASNALLESSFKQNAKESIAARSENAAKLEEFKKYLPDEVNPETYGAVAMGKQGIQNYFPRYGGDASEPVYQALLDEGAVGKKTMKMKDIDLNTRRERTPNSSDPLPPLEIQTSYGQTLPWKDFSLQNPMNHIRSNEVNNIGRSILMSKGSAESAQWNAVAQKHPQLANEPGKVLKQDVLEFVKSYGAKGDMDQARFFMMTGDKNAKTFSPSGQVKTRDKSGGTKTMTNLKFINDGKKITVEYYDKNKKKQTESFNSFVNKYDVGATVNSNLQSKFINTFKTKYGLPDEKMGQQLGGLAAAAIYN